MAEEIKKDSEKAAPEKKAKKSGKPGIFKRTANFFKEYKSEMKKVVWYPRSRVIHDTGIVVSALAICGAIIGVLDILFSNLILLLGKIG